MAAINSSKKFVPVGVTATNPVGVDTTTGAVVAVTMGGTATTTTGVVVVVTTGVVVSKQRHGFVTTGVVVVVTTGVVVTTTGAAVFATGTGFGTIVDAGICPLDTAKLRMAIVAAFSASTLVGALPVFSTPLSSIASQSIRAGLMVLS